MFQSKIRARDFGAISFGLPEQGGYTQSTDKRSALLITNRPVLDFLGVIFWAKCAQGNIS